MQLHATLACLHHLFSLLGRSNPAVDVSHSNSKDVTVRPVDQSNTVVS